MKVIAFYLPQYHSIPENDEWWGEGFTEWTTLKKAKPLFDGHNQPRIPLGNEYYNLLNDESKEWQCEIAKKYGIYGFCFYHYWFDGHLLLEKPVDQYLENRRCDLPFCICWANEHWTKAWESKEDTVLIEQRYGDRKQWVDHFNYFLPFFKDERYIKVDGKPLLVIYRPQLIECLNEMLDCWSNLAKENGLEGITYVYQHSSFETAQNRDDSRFSYGIEFQPGYALADIGKKKYGILYTMKRNLSQFCEKHFGFTIGIRSLLPGNKSIEKCDYDQIWKEVLSRKPKNEKYFPGAFVDWDNTPRRGEKGRVMLGASPEKFKKYFSAQVKRARNIYHKDFIFVTAWNEWTEGAYLEPDEKRGYANLEAIRDALIENNEFPEYHK